VIFLFLLFAQLQLVGTADAIDLGSTLSLTIMTKPTTLYKKTRSQPKSTEDFYSTTTARIQKIQSHIANAPRGTKLQNKVCVITGVGSLKGIGYINSTGGFLLKS
jgi:hypothetical protein